ncbi:MULTISPECIES: NB-ARC domain-containing protein [Calothrix]|uniref:ATP-binding protein n=2 Tax=Calothrix TaxID=1186 RepID=A0ABR8ALG6_9CYAN|nr:MULTISPECIES: NB-ARC domain-containing protein [Calothrix]MBD2199481.1 ATP-binding protein [Calothrix parietina FACHB-288]MBD2228139.1 ATP-binding protein [Calothrix anomala FACHB-343]
MPRSLKVHDDCIDQVKVALIRNGYPTQKSLAYDTGLALATVSKFLTGKAVGHANFEELCRKLQLDWREVSTPKSHCQLNAVSNNTKIIVKKNTSWGAAIDVSSFYGRSQELTQLKSWILEDGCRLVKVLGMAGVGKTTLATKLAISIQDQFEYVIWRAIQYTSSANDLLIELVSFLSNQQDTKPDINLLIHYLRTFQCLLILDNLETTLDADLTINYRSGYQIYSDLIRAISTTNHNSCLILTSREKPAEITTLERTAFKVRSLNLEGSQEVALHLLQSKQLLGSEKQKQKLCLLYSYNPLQINMVANAIIKLFDSKIDKFLEQNTLLLSNISQLLKQQLHRLSELEWHIMYCIAINQQVTSIETLAQKICLTIPKYQLLNAIERLIERSLIEKQAQGYIQKPVVMEYVVEWLKEQILSELINKEFLLFNQHLLVTENSIHCDIKNQTIVILRSITDQFCNYFPSRIAIKRHIQEIIKEVQTFKHCLSKYGISNFIHLCNYLEFELTTAEQEILQYCL